MVTFKEKSFIIEVHTGSNPIEDWLMLHEQLLDILRALDASSGITNNEFYQVLKLLQAMMPDWEMSKKMTT